MSYDPGSLSFALSSAIGEDPTLFEELRTVFIIGLGDHLDEMARADTPDAWRVATLRFKGLAATFGAIPLVTLANEALDRPLEEAIVHRIGAAVLAIG